MRSSSWPNVLGIKLQSIFSHLFVVYVTLTYYLVSHKFLHAHLTSKLSLCIYNLSVLGHNSCIETG